MKNHFESASESKKTLLLRCKDTIESLEQELQQEKEFRIDAEKQSRDLLRENSLLKEEIDELNLQVNTLKYEIQSQTEELGTFQKKKQKAYEELDACKINLEKEKAFSHHNQLELSKLQNFIDQLRGELKNKQDSIDEWNEAVSNVEGKLRSYSEENKSLKQAVEKYVAKCEELLNQNEELNGLWTEAINENKELKKTASELRIEKEQAYEKIRRANMQVHEHSTYLEKSSQISAQKMQEIIDKLENEKQKCSRLEKENIEINIKIEELKKNLAIQREEYENKFLITKEKETELVFELEKTKQQTEKQISKLNKEILAKEHLIAKMEADISFAKQESNMIMEAQAALQNNFKEISEKNSNLKSKLKEKEESINEKSKILFRLDEQIKIIEENSERELNSLYDSVEILKETLRSELFQKEQDYLKQIEEIKHDHEKMLEKDTLTREFDMESFRIEAQRSKDHYIKLLSIKEEELDVLNQDRKKLQDVIYELEGKVNDLSITLDQSIIERKKINAELVRHKENDLELSNKSTISNLRLQEENDQLNQRMTEEAAYFNQLLQRRDEEITQLKDKFEERLKKRVMISQEKISNWKTRLRQEIEFFRKSGTQDMQALNGFMDRLEKLISNISF
ncbi:unnamed protein product [Blepharisma stoltei]|uniref:Uncharacterized protein n=1 Tax=Blepharisma stoltei TaxID=1481888 RepID=A0AAU9JKN1_9CILI|nr:unnamed protein product [Blepharisma stoltei]